MKKVLLILCLSTLLSVVTSAQQQVLSFFDANGTIRLETQELDAAADTLVTVFHRKDDVVWARLLYRVIDLRYKQNYQLFFPFTADDPTYKSLIRVILDAVEEGMPIYNPTPIINGVKYDGFTPLFNDSTRVTPKEFVLDNKYFEITISSEDRQKLNEAGIEAGGDPTRTLIQYDSVSNTLIHNYKRYEEFSRNNIKYLIQEVVFFDRHTSRLHRQLIALAPLNPMVSEDTDPMVFMKESIRFWILYHDLRPYLAKNYMIPLLNETKRVTFDEFFQKRLYTSYLVGEGNMYNRMILDYAKKEVDAKKEQERIEAELLNFEQDLWEY